MLVNIMFALIIESFYLPHIFMTPGLKHNADNGKC